MPPWARARSAARIEALRGRDEMALDALQRALIERRSDLVWMSVDPVFDPVREHPRFRLILSHLGVSA